MASLRASPGSWKARCRAQASSRPAVRCSASPVDAVREAAQAAGAFGNGTTASTELRAAVAAAVDALPDQPTAARDLDLASTRWELLYTESQGGSAGVLGPFVGRVTQCFEAGGAGDGGLQFVNAVELGPLRLALTAKCSEASPTRLAVEFVDVAASVLGFEVSRKPLGPPGNLGWWEMKLASPDMRVLVANSGKIFILTRESS